MPLVSRSVSRRWVRARTPLALPGQRIGLLGGSFNPPHAGHVQITKTALHRLQLDCVWWVVTPGNPLKSNGKLPSLAARMAACRQLLSTPKVAITGFEADLGTPYTAATLDFLRRRYPGVRFVWIMGADNLAGFHRWQRWRDIADNVPIAVVDRPDWRLAATASPAARALARSFVPESEAACLPARTAPAWTFLGGPLSPLSSTALRAGTARSVAK
jgi:nicotinate-nucleotide adenylyltransferase